MKQNFDWAGLALVGMTVFFTVVVMGAKKLFPEDAALSASMNTLLGGFSGALLRHLVGPISNLINPPVKPPDNSPGVTQ